MINQLRFRVFSINKKIIILVNNDERVDARIKSRNQSQNLNRESSYNINIMYLCFDNSKPAQLLVITTNQLVNITMLANFAKTTIFIIIETI